MDPSTRTAFYRQLPSFKILAAALGIVVASSLLLAYFHSQKRENIELRYQTYAWHSDWIRTPIANSSVACFRKTVYVPGDPTNAYLIVAADNFYQLTVNGGSVTGYNHPAMMETLPQGATLYNELGYPRAGSIGNVYNLKRYLLPGRNIIAIYIQSDQGTPRMAVEGAIDAGSHQIIVGDDSWKASSHATSDHGVSWNQPDFSDDSWPNAVDTAQRVTVPIDGDVTCLSTPLFGGVIMPATVEPGISVIAYRRAYYLSDKLTEGWLRVNSPYAYDIYLNNELVGGTYSIHRYIRPLFAMQGFIDSLCRIQYSQLNYQYPEANPRYTIDTYTYQALFTKGANTLEIVAHPHQFDRLDSSPASICVDGMASTNSGGRYRFQSDSSWQVSQNGRPWQRAFVVGARDNELASYWINVIRGKIFPLHRIETDEAVAFAVSVAVMTLCCIALMMVLQFWFPQTNRQHGAILILVLLSGFLVLISAATIQTVFSSSIQDVMFSTERFAKIVLDGAAATWIVAAVVSVCRLYRRCRPVAAPQPPATRRTVDSDQSARFFTALLQSAAKCLDYAKTYAYAAVLALIVVAATVVYLHDLDRAGFIPDEYVSMLAARGILRHGIPIYEATGVIYARSALFHYILAPFMALAISTGDLGWTRMPSILWQLATIVLVYQFGKTLKGRPAGLIAALLTAFSPFMMYYARETRFYTQFGFFDTLTCYLLWQSVRNPDRVWYRIGTVLAYIGAYESQQLAVTLIPTMVIVVALSGRLKLWLEKRVLAAIALAGAVMFADIYLFLKYCQTPLPNIDIDSVLLVALHTDRLEMVPSMLLMSNEREQIVICGFFIFNLLFAAARVMFRKRRPETGAPGEWHWVSYLNLQVAVQCLLVALIIPRPVSRYAVHLVPLLCLAASCTLVAFTEHVANWLSKTRIAPANIRLVVNCMALLVVFAGLASYRPIRVWDSTSRDVNRNLTSCARYVAANEHPGDKVIFFSPEVAMIELGHCDYMWRPAHGSIYKYIGRDGVLRERNSGAIVVDNVDKLRDVTLRSNRVWIVLHKSALSGTATDVTDYSDESLLMSEFVGNNYQIVYEAFSTEVLLWDRSDNRYVNNAPYQGYDEFHFE